MKIIEDHEQRMIEKGLAVDPKEAMEAKKAQAPPPGAPGQKPQKNPAARGNPDLDVDRQSGKREKKEQRDRTNEVDKRAPVRGEGRKIKKGE